MIDLEIYLRQRLARLSPETKKLLLRDMADWAFVEMMWTKQYWEAYRG